MVALGPLENTPVGFLLSKLLRMGMIAVFLIAPGSAVPHPVVVGVLALAPNAPAETPQTLSEMTLLSSPAATELMVLLPGATITPMSLLWIWLFLMMRCVSLAAPVGTSATPTLNR